MNELIQQLDLIGDTLHWKDGTKVNARKKYIEFGDQKYSRTDVLAEMIHARDLALSAAETLPEGVFWSTHWGKYIARTKDGRKHLGMFDTVEEAAREVNHA